METRRQYAARLGLAEAGARGRLSKEAHSAINKALAEGMRFSDVPVDSAATEPITSEKATKIATADSFTGPTPEKTFDGGWFVWEGKKKRTISGAEVCRKCKVSLDWHRCNLPVIPSIETNEMIPVMR